MPIKISCNAYIQKGVGGGPRAALRFNTGQFCANTGVSKASHPIIESAQKHEKAMARSFERLIEVVRGKIKLKDLEEACRNQDGGAVMSLIDIEERMQAVASGSNMSPNARTLKEEFERAFSAGTDIGLKMLDKLPLSREIGKGIGAAMAFDLLSPEAIAFIRTHLFDLITDVSRETRLAIQQVVLKAFQEGGHPYDQARTIRAMIGLTQRQALAVDNYRRSLMSGQYQEALRRSLRDGRYDATLRRMIKDNASLTKAQIDKMVERYRERYIKYRAETIARTETLRASNAGLQETWRQAQEQGLLGPNMKQKWIITPDERLCDLCEETKVLNAAGVPIGGDFQTPNGPVKRPPLHVSCRCSIGLVYS